MRRTVRLSVLPLTRAAGITRRYVPSVAVTTPSLRSLRNTLAYGNGAPAAVATVPVNTTSCWPGCCAPATAAIARVARAANTDEQHRIRASTVQDGRRVACWSLPARDAGRRSIPRTPQSEQRIGDEPGGVRDRSGAARDARRSAGR